MYVQVRMVIRKFLSSENACNEGEVRSMYLDNKGLVTTGVGNFLPTATSANEWQWQKIANGAFALPADVTAEYERVRSADTKLQIPNWPNMGGGNFIKEATKLGIVTLQLTDRSFGVIFNNALDGLEGTMKGTPGFEDFDRIPGGFPADAQLGIISVIWAIGAGPLKPGGWKGDFSQLCGARQWGEIATKEKYKWRDIRDDRNRTTKKVFENAQRVEDQRKTMPAMDVTIVSPPFSDLFLSS